MRLAFRLPLILALIGCSLVACTRDPNVRKQKYYESGQRYFEKGKYHEAAIQFNNAIQTDPNFASAHYQLAMACLKLQQVNRAYQEFTRVTELEPNNYKAHIEIAKLLISNGQFKEAKEQHLDLLVEQDANDPDVHQALAGYQAGVGNLPGALQEMQKAIALDPNRSDLYLTQGLLQFSAQQFDAAETSFKKATALDPKSMNAQMALGGFYQRRGQYAEAEQQFRHAMQVDPKDPEPRSALVRLLTSEGNRAEAEKVLRQTKEDLPDNSVGYRMLGDWYFANGDLDRATTEYESLYKQHPKDVRVRKNFAQLLVLKNRLDEAGQITDGLLKQFPQDDEALDLRGQILLSQGKPSQAVNALQAALQSNPNSGVAHDHLGKAFAQLGNFTRAENEWRDAVRLRPDLFDAQTDLAASLNRKQDWNGLYDAASTMIESRPTAVDGYAFRAIAASNLGRKDQAEQDVQKAIEVAPKNAIGYIQQGNLRLMDKRYPEAEKVFQTSLSLDPKSTDALNGLMRTYLAQKDTDKAVAAANAQIAKVPDSSGFYDLLGTALFEGKKDYQAAAVAFSKAIALDKTNSDAYLKLGQAYLAAGSTDQALATYQQGVKDNPRDATLHVFLGEVYERNHSWEDAKATYRKALDLQPDNPIASNNLAYLLLQEGGNVDLALAMAQTARRAMPDSPSAADTLGWAFYQKGAYANAIDLFKEAVQKKPNDAVFHYHLGMAYEKADQPAAAREHLRQVLKISPNFTDASEVKKALSELGGL